MEGDSETEIAIIGGGYTGLSAAYHLARDHGIKARVLEAGPIGFGASGRNGGFCGLGSAKLSYPRMVVRFGLEETAGFIRAQVEAVELVRALGGDERLAFDAQGSGTITVAHRPSRQTELEAEAAILTRHGGGPVALWSRDELRARGYASPEAFGALHQAVGFGLHPLKYLRGLADAALKRGARIHAESPVVSWRSEAGRHVLVTPRGCVRAKRVIIATNGFTRESLHPGLAGTLLPVLSNIVVTRPLRADEIAAQGYTTETPVSDTRHLLSYVRLLSDRRFMFGARGGLDAVPGAIPAQRAWMERCLGEMYPAWRGIETTHFFLARAGVLVGGAHAPYRGAG
ncbi:MAG: FAD-binding oxidoreductase [Alphaproteobacteria bacterium]|nr:FAD-binding oxidoreductase [Alphaproteobacteria bacterium]